MKYVKKPIPVSAIQWTGKNSDEIHEFCTDEKGKKFSFQNNEHIWINTNEGNLKAKEGDYIIQGIEGEFYPCDKKIFEKSYVVFEATSSKTLGNTTASQAKDNVKDIVFWGDGDTFKLISKASSEKEGWMKSTKAMEIVNVGCVVQTTTQQRNPDGSYALTDSVCFVPNCHVEEIQENPTSKVVGRKLVANN